MQDRGESKIEEKGVEETEIVERKKREEGEIRGEMRWRRDEKTWEESVKNG